MAHETARQIPMKKAGDRLTANWLAYVIDSTYNSELPLSLVADILRSTKIVSTYHSRLNKI